MSDLRATERLLEVIFEEVLTLREHRVWATTSSEHSTNEHGDRDETHHMVSLDSQVLAIKEAITELRRRGDTLVRRDDLIALYDGYGDDCPEGTLDMLERIQNTIGRKP